jgi:hypothetical protein
VTGQPTVGGTNYRRATTPAADVYFSNFLIPAFFFENQRCIFLKNFLIPAFFFENQRKYIYKNSAIESQSQLPNRRQQYD